MKTEISVNTQNGAKVADAFISHFLCTGILHQNLFKAMFLYRQAGHNLVLLSIQWLHVLSQARPNNFHNAKSIAVAQDIVKNLKITSEYSYTQLISETRPVSRSRIIISLPADAARIAYLLSCHLTRGNTDSGVFVSFIESMKSAKPELQEVFTRFCIGWCSFALAKYPTGSSTSMLTADILSSGKIVLLQIDSL